MNGDMTDYHNKNRQGFAIDELEYHQRISKYKANLMIKEKFN